MLNDQKTKKTFLVLFLAGLILSGFLGFFVGLSFTKNNRNEAFALVNPGILNQIKNFIFPTPKITPTPILSQPSAPPIPSSAESYEIQIVNAIKAASLSVVSIIITKNLPVIEQYYINPFQEFGFELPPGFGIPQFRQRGSERQEVGGGTGFIISSDGLILTNRHVVADTDADYTVLTNDGNRYSAKILARDPTFDLAVLKIDKAGLTALPLGDSDRVEIGQTAIAIGNALGEFRNTASVGIISGLARTVEASGELLSDVIQTDAAINPGNSGGPLLNLRGEAIGVNTAMARGAENIGFAIPINQAKRIINQITSTGRISVPFLGVRYQLVSPSLKEEKKLAVDYGALLVSGENEPAVVPASPAQKAGLKEGDIILELNNEKISLQKPLAILLRKYNVGDTVTLKIMRGTRIMNLSVTLAERP